MNNVPMEELLAKTGSIYKLVVLASRRASELTAGAPKLVEAAIEEKVSTIALQEILQDKVGIKPADVTKKKNK